MNKLFRFVSVLVVLVMVLGFFAAPMRGESQVSAQKEVPTFVVAPTEVPTQEPSAPPAEQPTSLPGTGVEVPVDPGVEITPEPTESTEVVPLIEAAAEVAVPGRYIIVFKDGVDKDAARQAALAKIAAGGGRVTFEYKSALDGLAAELTPETLRLLRQDGRIEYIEQDQKVKVNDEETPFSAQSLDNSPDSWGLDRIDQIDLPLDGNYYYPALAGQGVNVYIIDTGIRSTHEQYAGRVSLDFDAIGGSTTYAEDCDGHGTHVAGTVGGNTTGVARKVQLHSVRVLDCTGSGYTSHIIAGINWVAQNHVKPAVANMSLGGYVSSAEDAAVSKAISKGVTFVVAAGNSSGNACNYSPARVPGAITVGATDNTDTRANFSNYGKCVDVFAPGVSIMSSTIDSDASVASKDGTSMASPHVAGVAALYLAANPTAKPAQVAAYITSTALQGVVTDPVGSPNRLLHISNQLPTSISLVSPANNLTISDRTPELRWKTITNGDQYYVTIAEDANFSTIIYEGLQAGNSFVFVSDLADGDYFWRIIGINVDETQEIWSANWKFNIDATGPDWPVKTFPAENATMTGNPSFKWMASPSAKTYRFAYNMNGNPSSGFDFISPKITKTEYKPTVTLPNGVFFWFVQAFDSLGNEGLWSNGTRVTVIPLKPVAPKLVAPVNNFYTNNPNPEFSWTGVLYGVFYDIQIASEPTFASDFIVNESGAVIDTLSYSFIAPLVEGKYYWRVKARNGAGTYSDWSAARSIIIDRTEPGAPNVNVPADGATIVGNPTFTWTVMAGTKFYNLQLGDTEAYDNNNILFAGILKSSYKPVQAIPAGDWYWRVQAIDFAGNPGDWSASRLLHIQPLILQKYH